LRGEGAAQGYFSVFPSISRDLHPSTRFINALVPMANKKSKHDSEWAEAKSMCRLNMEDIRMAKELGMSPRSLRKNVPGPNQRWKLPVKDWIRELYEKRFEGKKAVPESVKPLDAYRQEHIGNAPRDPNVEPF
jgi:hypothetical protein